MTPISTLYPSHADTFPVPCPSPPLTRQQHTPPSLTLPSQPPLSNLSQTSPPPPHLPPPPPAPTGNERAKKTTSKPLHIPPLPQPTTSPFTHCSTPPSPLGATHTQSITHARCGPGTRRDIWRLSRRRRRCGPILPRLGPVVRSVQPTGTDPGVCRLKAGGPPGSEVGAELAGPIPCLGRSEIWLGLLWMGGNDAGGVEMYSCTVPGQIGKGLCVSELQLSREWWAST